MKISGPKNRNFGQKIYIFCDKNPKNFLYKNRKYFVIKIDILSKKYCEKIQKKTLCIKIENILV